MRITNPWESFHSHFNSVLHSSSKYLSVLRSFKKRKIDTYIKMRSSEIMKKRNCILLKEKFINDKMNEKNTGITNQFHFVKLMSYTFLPTPM